MALNGYAQTYDEGEISEVTTDFVMEYVIGALAFVSLIVLVVLFVWLKTKLN